MKCKECAHGRRFAKGSVNCILYGMIIREDHECRGKGVIRRDGDDDHGEDREDETELSKNRGGTAGEVPGVLPAGRERTGLSGREGREGGGI